MTDLTDKDFKKIIARRDRRYDGRFYFGVITTGIYCRPICPARPKPENIRIFKSMSEAENNGFRPCRRCRPDAAPGSKLLDGTMNTVARALRIIQSAEGDSLDVERLAAMLGVSDRHLRRLFDDHLGASPIDIMVTRRLHFAKKVLHESAMPVAAVAYASGFHSLRRFNEAFKEHFHVSPTQMRRQFDHVTDAVLTLRIPIRLPYDFDQVLAYLKRHETYGVEGVEGGTYYRFVLNDDGIGSVHVSRGRRDQDHLVAAFHDIPLVSVRGILERLKILFDTEHNPADLPSDAALDPRGIRVPGCYDPFETAVAIILGQLVSTAAAKKTLRMIVERFGRRYGSREGREVILFPTPAVIATAALEEIGMTKTKAGAIRGLAQAVQSGRIDFKAHSEFAVTAAALLTIRGIGPWTTAMMAMRCLGNPDAFPDGDLIVRRALDENFVDASRWSAARAYLTHCLWRDFSSSSTKGA